MTSLTNIKSFCPHGYSQNLTCPECDNPPPRIYGRWAGNPKGTKEDPARCVACVAGGPRDMLRYQCSRKRGHGPKGLYCKQHSEKLKRSTAHRLGESHVKDWPD